MQDREGQIIEDDGTGRFGGPWRSITWSIRRAHGRPLFPEAQLRCMHGHRHPALIVQGIEASCHMVQSYHHHNPTLPTARMSMLTSPTHLRCSGGDSGHRRADDRGYVSVVYAT